MRALCLHGQGPRAVRRTVRLAQHQHGSIAERGVPEALPDPGIADAARHRSEEGVGRPALRRRRDRPQLREAARRRRAVHRGARSGRRHAAGGGRPAAARASNAEAAKSYEDGAWRRRRRTGGASAARRSRYLSRSDAPTTTSAAPRVRAGRYPQRERHVVGRERRRDRPLRCAAGDRRRNARARIEHSRRRRAKSIDDPKIVLSGDDRSGMYHGADRRARRGRRTKRASREADRRNGRRSSTRQRRRRRPRSSARSTTRTASAPTSTSARRRRRSRCSSSPSATSRRLQPAGASGRRLQGDEEVRRGPRRLRPRAHARLRPAQDQRLRNRADIYLAKGDKENARKTLEEAIDYANGLPKGQRSEHTIASLKKKLGTI